jgi:hypothetical protein
MARGEYVTGLDSDDWAHPRWLERQVAPLLEDPETIMSIAEGIRCSADLEPAISPVLRLTEPRSTSIMYRAQEVRERVGFYDTVVKSGDTEFKLRIQRTFGKERVVQLDGLHLTVVRQRPGSLSDGDVTAGWVTPARFAYSCAFKQWHRRIQQGRANAFVPASAPERAFPAPRALLEWDAAPERFDLVVAADWRRLDQTRRELLERAAEAKAEGQDVAIAHYVEWGRLDAELTSIAPQVLSFAAEHDLAFADLERVGVAHVIAYDDALLLGLREDYPAVRDAEAEAIREVELAEPKPLKVKRPRPRPKDLLLAAVACCALALAGALASGNSTVAALTAASAGVAAVSAIGTLMVVLAIGRIRR